METLCSINKIIMHCGILNFGKQHKDSLFVERFIVFFRKFFRCSIYHIAVTTTILMLNLSTLGSKHMYL